MESHEVQTSAAFWLARFGGTKSEVKVTSRGLHHVAAAQPLVHERLLLPRCPSHPVSSAHASDTPRRPRIVPKPPIYFLKFSKES